MENEKIKISIARNLKSLRISKNLTQEKLSFISGVDTRQIQRIEAGITDPRLTTVYRLSRALECKIDDFLDKP